MKVHQMHSSQVKKHAIILAQKGGPGNGLCAPRVPSPLWLHSEAGRNGQACVGSSALAAAKARTWMHGVYEGSDTSSALWGTPVNTPAQDIVSLGPKKVPCQSQKTFKKIVNLAAPGLNCGMWDL